MALNRYPRPKMDHLVRLTDSTGMIQHAAYSLPDRDTGYTADDNARALIVALGLERMGVSGTGRLVETYMAYLKHSQRADGRFHNLMDYSRRFVDEVGSEDCLGRCVWAAGEATLSEDPAITLNAERVLKGALPWCAGMNAPRARAQAILGVSCYLRALKKRSASDGEVSSILEVVSFLADSLVCLRERSSGSDWQWFEEVLTYDNALMPAALYVAYRETRRESYLESARATLSFLTAALWHGRFFKAVGNQGWYRRGQSMARHDEQPVDMGALVLACDEAYCATSEERYYRMAHLAFQWFLGRNSIGKTVYDERTGGCHDGITPDGVNLNMGAESLLAFFLAYLRLSRCARKRQHVAA